MTSRNGYFPGKTKAKRSAIITPRTAQETQIAAMPRQSRAARQALAKTPPLRVGGDGLVEGADRIMRTPTEHQAAGVAFKVARIYLRVSTDQQDVDNQRHGILEYANQQGISGLQFVEDTVSGKVKWKERRIGDLLLKTMQPGDTVVFAEISRMARSTLQVLEMLEHATTTNLQVHIAKQRMRFDDSLNSKITATVLGLAAEIEREFISMRTKEALAKRKADGKTLGRPKGKAETVKLDARREEIMRYLKKDISKRSIAKLVDCSKSTLYNWLEREGLNKKKPKTAKAPATTP